MPVLRSRPWLNLLLVESHFWRCAGAGTEISVGRCVKLEKISMYRAPVQVLLRLALAADASLVWHLNLLSWSNPECSLRVMASTQDVVTYAGRPSMASSLP